MKMFRIPSYMLPPFKLDFSILLSVSKPTKRCPYAQCLFKIIELSGIQVNRKSNNLTPGNLRIHSKTSLCAHLQSAEFPRNPNFQPPSTSNRPHFNSSHRAWGITFPQNPRIHHGSRYTSQTAELTATPAHIA